MAKKTQLKVKSSNTECVKTCADCASTYNPYGERHNGGYIMAKCHRVGHATLLSKTACKYFSPKVEV